MHATFAYSVDDDFTSIFDFLHVWNISILYIIIHADTRKMKDMS